MHRQLTYTVRTDFRRCVKTTTRSVVDFARGAQLQPRRRRAADPPRYSEEAV